MSEAMNQARQPSNPARFFARTRSGLVQLRSLRGSLCEGFDRRR